MPQGVQKTPAHWFNCIQKVQNNKAIQNSIYCWIETTQIKKEESPQSKFYNNIRDLPIKSFWYHNSDTKRNPWVMLCSHFPISDSSGYLHNTVYLAVCYKPLGILQRVTKSQKVHISHHDGFEKLHNISFVWHRSQGFPEREQSSTNFPFPQSNFLRTIDLLFFKQVFRSIFSDYYLFIK